VHQYRHSTAKGPDGQPLFADVALLGPADAANVVVVISGTHGVEGFCGSAVQTGLLRSGLAEQLPDGVRVVFIHAINPYGFAWLRRFNEDNVDLNRNFVDHAQPYPKNEEYDKLANAIAPPDCTEAALRRARSKLFDYAKRHGETALQAAITQGQYNHPTGLFYGGGRPVWSNKLVHKIVHEHLAGSRNVVLIDIHTGLGDCGEGKCLMSEPPGSAAVCRARSCWGDRVESTRTGESISADLTGAGKYAFARMLPAGTEVTAISLEFGTCKPTVVFFAMQAENCLCHHGTPGDLRAKEVKTELRRVFYPDMDDWKNAAWKQSREIVAQALGGAANLKEHD
jgi:hypothetical protein